MPKSKQRKKKNKFKQVIIESKFIKKGDKEVPNPRFGSSKIIHHIPVIR